MSQVSGGTPAVAIRAWHQQTLALRALAARRRGERGAGGQQRQERGTEGQDLQAVRRAAKGRLCQSVYESACKSACKSADTSGVAAWAETEGCEGAGAVDGGGRSANSVLNSSNNSRTGERLRRNAKHGAERLQYVGGVALLVLAWAYSHGLLPT